jgi:hypothetical protein
MKSTLDKILKLAKSVQNDRKRGMDCRMDEDWVIVLIQKTLKKLEKKP